MNHLIHTENANPRPKQAIRLKHLFRTHTLIVGTIFLTATGFLSRILGFFYRIYLSRTIGAEGLGIYQMVFPVYGICFSLCAGSIQTAISRFTAAERTRGKQTLLAGFLVSFSISLILAGIISSRAEFIAVHILMEPKCAPLLPALALAIPCTSLHACICGYYYGREKVQVPALSQLIEQCIRIFTVFLISDICRERGYEVTVLVAVIGLVAGEAGSAVFALLSFSISQTIEHSSDAPPPLSPFLALPTVMMPLMSLALPLMANRLVMNLMQSAEAILIPNRLELFGLSDSQAISIYGVLTGMAMPFIMFPSAIVNSLAVVLLPTVARQQSSGNESGIQKSISMSFRYSLYMGILCIGVFTVFGEDLGNTVFHNSDAGSFIMTLAWLCPFLYLATTMGSILNGLGKTSVTFIHNFISLSIRLFFVFLGIPRFGILACLWGMLAAEIVLVLLHYFSIYKLVSFTPNVWEIIVKPVFCLLVSLGIYNLFPKTLPILFPVSIPDFFIIAFRIFLVCAGYVLSLLLFHKNEAGEK